MELKVGDIVRDKEQHLGRVVSADRDRVLVRWHKGYATWENATGLTRKEDEQWNK